VEDDSKTRQLRKFARLRKTQHPTAKTSKETVINLSGWMLEDGLSSLLQKGPNYAVAPHTISIEDTLAGVGKAVQSLPIEMAEEARQETVRIIKSSSRPRDNLTRAEREALRALKKTLNSPSYRQTKAMLPWFSTLWTTNRKSPPFFSIHHIEYWLGTPLIRQNEKPHYCLKNPPSQKTYANNCVRPAADLQDCKDFQRYIKRVFL